MKRYLKYIFLALAVTVLAASCIEEIELETPVFDSETLTLVPRVQSFANRYVTKADYEENETKISEYTVLVFNNDGNLVHRQYVQGDSPFKLNKSMLNSSAYGDLTDATVVMLANMKYDDIDNGGSAITKLSDFENCTYKPSRAVITSIEGDNFAGFPMIGGAKNQDLTSTKVQQPAIEIPLSILYAKIYFKISVEQGDENQNVGPGMQFVLSGCTVHNSATATSFAIPTADDATPSSNYNGSAATSLGKTGTANLNGDKINFTFYVLESRYNPSRDLRGIYPDDNWLTSKNEEDVKGYKSPEDDDKLNGVKYFYDDRIQQYKPKLARDGKATYVKLNGIYTDYRGTAWDVDYMIYLGKDNAQNFQVDRNSEYTNIITIKGIRNNDDYYDIDENGNKVDKHIWIDHRVNVTYNDNGADDHVTITRETLLDAHIEVRPLRVKWNEGEYDGVRVYLPTDSNGNLISWIGIERFTGNNNREASVYCYANGKSTGKRKYFTTSLINELQTKAGEFGVREDNGKKYIYLLNGECAWIYFDENTSSSDRNAEIILDFYENESDPTHSVVYKVKQCHLQSVGGYAIESYEEYLHSYDSDDKYDLTTSPQDYTQQGLVWGFSNHKLSQNTIVNATDVPTNLIKNEIVKRRYVYDYFHESDGSSFHMFINANGNWKNAEFGTGLSFTDRAAANRDIAVKDMGTVPENAYQYCLSKNKFEADDFGNVSMTINWYLPDVYEMQTILAASQSGKSTVDLDRDAFYWSSQPSFERMLDIEIFGTRLSLINEMTDNARAVSARGITDLSRKSQNRIRCVYAKTGIVLDEEDMEDRVPEGIGGNLTFWMKAWNGTSEGYFNYMLPTAPKPKDETTITVSNESLYDSDAEIYPYPTKSNPGDFQYTTTKDKNNKSIEGFEVNPDADFKDTNWEEYNYRDGYYYTLANFPGLSSNTLTKATAANAYKENSNSPKTKTESKISTTTIALDNKLQSYQGLEPLDRSTSQRLNISFASNGSPEPQFIYKDEQQTTIINTWQWLRAKYTGTTYTLKEQNVTLTSDGEGTKTGVDEPLLPSYYNQASEDAAKKDAFNDQTSWGQVDKGAYTLAKENAKENLDDLIKKYQQEGGWTIPDYSYTSLTWKDDAPSVKWDITKETEKDYRGRTYTKKVTAICTVTVTASVTLTKPGSLTLYLQTTGTGCWGEEVKGTPKPTGGGRTSDELRIYCGNSFTISLSEAAKAEGYEITKVKVLYSGDNYVGRSGGIFGFGADNVYARFVESTIDLSKYKLENQPVIGSTEVLQLPGMDYSADGASGWHQWSADGRSSITLVLADYNVNNNAGVSYSYMYDTSPLKSEKYIIVDQIEVKCTKRKNATFDFKQIYTEGGNIETSYSTVKHITFTVEGGTEDKPSGATAEGLKLYAGSKVTFKALDGYVINSISGDESLTFKGSRQTVEFPGLPEKTITAPIVVLYSKADSGTN